ncbi:glutamine amidotransferase [Geitlerinema sp. PCC 9228]|uniref:glutamine amidotransferase n=1 Tax=Geitlerinema sp. PCC 9228 TaxID=111611 RepID=UPI0008F9A0B6|nr:glutamine amidotransferase [Geitlerinema sp. PCC 9228]
MSKNAIAIRHVPFEDLGTLTTTLQQRNYTITYLEAGLNPIQTLDPLTPDLLVVLGGPIGAYDNEDYPFLNDEIRLLAKRLQADLPTLGICLGAQLMASALNARVYPGTPEIGWSPLELTPAGKTSPLKHLSPERTSVLHWHGDTFDLPEGATQLASTPVCQNQAFSWGDRGLALQFHPEVTAANLERWFIGHARQIGTAADLSVAGLRQETARYAPALEAQAPHLWQEWLAAVETTEVSAKPSA